VIFLAGLYTTLTYSTHQFKEAFGAPYQGKRCPDLLIQDGSQLILKNSELVDVPGVNPVRFNNLEDYAEFVQWQRSQGISCPVLYYTKSYDAQSHEGYLPTALPPISDNSMGLNPYTDKPPFGDLTYPAMDPHNQTIGEETALNKYFYAGESDPVSANAVDTNWGGSQFSNEAIARNHYEGNEVYKNAEPVSRVQENAAL
jgi:hypothetical protein